ncbi:MAG TPA: serine/threonine-protein kinase [Propionibacteriaceae bacterium]|nr:serine/threonine-protein kinase [Propionibacteriaceae bacterium]
MADPDPGNAISGSDVEVLAPGTQIAPGYEVVEHISRGDALDVYEVFSAERLCSCIAKTIRPDRADIPRVQARLLQEGRLLQELTHPLLVRGYETITEPQIVVIVETVTALNLEELLDERPRRLPVADVCHLGRHVAAATHYLHGQGYLHLDIRPANVLADSGLAKLIDLSLARPPGPIPRGLGSREHMAPEQAAGEPATAAADVWGIGVTLYEAVTCVRPFAPLDEHEEQVVLPEVRYLQLHRPAPPLSRWRRRLPRDFVSIVEACLQRDPGKRPSVTSLWDALGEVIGNLEPVEP